MGLSTQSHKNFACIIGSNGAANEHNLFTSVLRPQLFCSAVPIITTMPVKVLDVFLRLIEQLVIWMLASPLAAYYRGAKFIYRLGLDVYDGVEESKVTLNTSVGEMRAKVFRPTDRSRSMPTITIIHGLALSGYEDHRVLQLCRAFAGTGATVVAPHIEGLTTCVISVERIDEVTAVIDAVASNKTLCEPGKRIAVMSACITAGFALLSSVRTKAIGAVMCIGTHASARHVLAHCVEFRGLGGSMYATEAALMTAWAKGDPELQALFQTSLNDDHLLIKGTAKATLPEAIKKLPRAGKVYTELMSNFDNVGRALVEAYDVKRDMWEQISPIRYVKEFQCKSVTMIHSSTDGIIPSNESRLLYEAIKKLRPDVKANVKLTDLLDHGDKHQLGVSALPEAIAMVKTMASFYSGVWHEF